MKEKLILVDLKKIYTENQVPENIVRHMEKVAAVSLLLAEKIKVIHKTELITAAMCHDICKLHGPEHEDRAADYFLNNNMPLVAEIIRKHKYSSLIDPVKTNQPQTIEEKIAYYADKRVLHDQLVTIEQRLADGRKRYPILHGMIEKDQKTEQLLRKLEKEICDLASLAPSDINESAIAADMLRLRKYIE